MTRQALLDRAMAYSAEESRSRKTHRHSVVTESNYKMGIFHGPSFMRGASFILDVIEREKMKRAKK